MDALIHGLHHVTATTADAQADLDFYRGLLGLRLVKRTVNFDNPGVYHFYYGDERGSPSTLMTTFPYRGMGVPEGSRGAGQLTLTSFTVPEDSLAFWAERFAEHGRSAAPHRTPFGEPALTLSDPSGLKIELVEDAGDNRSPWAGGGIPVQHAIRGIHRATLTVRSSERTRELLQGPLGFELVAQVPSRTRMGTGAGGPGKILEILEAPEAPEATNGLGTVHHVAMAIAGGDEQLRLRSELLRLGLRVTEVRDRQYFQSIYFREPGGVLFEVATVEPGFLTDEEVGTLGTDLMLPPWEESNRATIESALPPVSNP